jgi:hypothetical protein
MSNANIKTVPATHPDAATGVDSILRTIAGRIDTAVITAGIASASTPKAVPLMTPGPPSGPAPSSHQLTVTSSVSMLPKMSIVTLSTF